MRYASQDDAHRTAFDPASEAAFLSRELAHALRHRDSAKIMLDGDCVSIPRLSPDGPDVSAVFRDGRCTVSIGCWHDDMPAREQALDYILKAVDGSLRVRIDRIGGKIWQCALEQRDADGQWTEESVLVFPRFTLWPRQKTTTYLVNAS